MNPRIILFSLFLLPVVLFGQYNWELEKEKNGIKVYSSDVSYSDFKATKVECTLDGDYEKLISILSNVDEMNTWVYKSKACRLIESYSPQHFVYHSETNMPWPLMNRESVIRFQFNTDSLPKFMCITGVDEQDLVPVEKGLERVTEYRASWMVSMPSDQKLLIEYILELNPGGGVPSWLANMMIEKGPYETFCNLADKLKEETELTISR